jgi:nucleoid-associated protein YgaU
MLALPTARADGAPQPVQATVAVEIAQVADAGVAGVATLTRSGDTTTVALTVAGLPPGAHAQSTLHAGTCAMPSASFTDLPTLAAGPDGRATAAGPVLFRDAGMPLATLADGHHVIMIQLDGRVVACGAIPGLAPGAPTGPGPDAFVIYVVAWGDTLWALAQRSDTTIEALLAANPEITNPDLISVGQQLRIPLPGEVTAYSLRAQRPSLPRPRPGWTSPPAPLRGGAGG